MDDNGNDLRDIKDDEEPQKLNAVNNVFQERRKKADWLIKSAAVMSALAWVVAFVVWLILDVAARDSRWLFLRGGDIDSAYWDESLLAVSLTLLLISLGICCTAFVFNKLRMRRKTDKYRKSVFVIGGITIISIIAFLIRFGDNFLW